METGDPSRPYKRPAAEKYPSSEAAATPLFDRILRPLLQSEGRIPFSRLMDLALYHDEFGYYSDPGRTRVGREGDFATNVSVGETFGRLLATRLQQYWKSQGSPEQFEVFELGPEDGTLALDIVRAARALEPSFHASLHYRACEHHSRKRQALNERFATSGEEQLRVISPPKEHQADLGVVLANEVLDALPVDLYRFHSGSWHTRFVRLAEDASHLIWEDEPAADCLLAQMLGETVPEDYQSEFCPALEGFFGDLATIVDRGLFLFIDYGLIEDDYYHPDRSEGTLQTYLHHQAGDDPLDSPGMRDITTHVNFTEAARQAHQAGLVTHGFARQEAYLTHLAAPILQTLPDDPGSLAFIRQFRTLTHPGFFGSRFHALEFIKGEPGMNFTFPCPSQSLGLP